MATANNASSSETSETGLPPAETTPSETSETGLKRVFPTTIIMTVAEWIDVPGNPHQRDTERHLIRAKHLRNPSPAHLQVNAAQLPDGMMVKLDGHTRARLWQLNPELAPENVLAAVYAVNSVEEANELYHHFDNKAAVDTASDDLSGAFGAIGFEPQSPLFRSYKGTWALKVATSAMLGRAPNGQGLDIYKVVPLWLDELQAIDRLDATTRRFGNPMIMAALLTIRRRGQPAIECWDRYQRDAGTKTETGMDGVEALSRVNLTGRSGGGAGNSYTMAGKAISCIEAACRQRILGLKLPGGTSPAGYCSLMRREGRLFEKALLVEVQRTVAEQQRVSNAVRRYVLQGPGKPH